MSTNKKMVTVLSETCSFEDHLSNKILNKRSNACAQKTLYDFESVDHSFNVKIIPEPTNNNHIKTPIMIENSTDISNTLKPAVNQNNSHQELKIHIPVPVVEIMLPEDFSRKPTTSKRFETPSEVKLNLFTPIKLFKYSRFHRLNKNNISTPKNATKTPIFKSTISPILKEVRKIISRTENNIKSSSNKNTPVNSLNGLNQNIRRDYNNTGYCTFHNQTRLHSNQKTITKSKYMSLQSVTSRTMHTPCNSNTVDGTMSMSFSNATNRSTRSNISDTSSSDSSQEIPNINDETILLLSRMHNDISKPCTVQRTIIGSSQILDWSSDDSFNTVRLSGHKRVQQNDEEKEATLVNISKEQHDIAMPEEIRQIIRPPSNYNIDHCRTTDESDSSSEDDDSDGCTKLSRILSISDRIEIQQKHISEDNATITNMPIIESQGLLNRPVIQNTKPRFNDNSKNCRAPEESSCSSEDDDSNGCTSNSTITLDRVEIQQKDISEDKGNEATITNIPSIESPKLLNRPVIHNTKSYFIENSKPCRAPEESGCSSQDDDSNGCTRRNRNTLNRIEIQQKDVSEHNGNEHIPIIESPRLLNRNIIHNTKPSFNDNSKPSRAPVESSSSEVEDSNVGTRQTRNTTNTLDRIEIQQKDISKDNGNETKTTNIPTTESSNLSSRAVSHNTEHCKTDSGVAQLALAASVNFISQSNEQNSTANCKTGKRKLARLPNQKVICMKSNRKPSNSSKSSDCQLNELIIGAANNKQNSVIRVTRQRTQSILKANAENNLEAKAPRKISIIKPIDESNSKFIDKMANKSSITQRNSSFQLNKSLAAVTSSESQPTTPIVRRSSRPPKPKYVDPLPWSRRIIPLKHNNNQQNKNNTTRQNSTLQLNKSLAGAINSEPQAICTTGIRRSSRLPKPMHAYWLTGSRPIIPVIRDINQLADKYDFKIPIILLPPKMLSNKAMKQLLNQIKHRMG